MSGETIPCRVCHTTTHMLGTKLCDPCWEICNAIESAVNRGLIRKIQIRGNLLLAPTHELTTTLEERDSG